MKKLLMVISLVLVLCFVFSCQQGEEVAEEVEPVVDLEAEKTSVKAVIDQFTQSIEVEDIELFSKLHAHDADMVIFGTDAAENFVGWETWKDAMSRMFESFEESEISVNDLSIKVNETGKAAWATAIYDWTLKTMGEPIDIKGMRISLVLEKRNGNWLICHMHGSMPVEGQVAEY